MSMTIWWFPCFLWSLTQFMTRDLVFTFINELLKYSHHSDAKVQLLVECIALR